MYFSGILSPAITRIRLPLEAHGTKYELISLELSTQVSIFALSGFGHLYSPLEI